MNRQEEGPHDGAVKKVRLLTVYFFVIMLIGLLTNLGSQLLDTSRALYVQSLGGSASFTGLLLTATAGSATVARIFTGRTSDKRGRRGLIIIGSVVFAAAAASFSFFPYLSAFPVICLVRGAGMSMASTAISIAITDVIPRERMGEGLGYYGLAMPLTNVIGPAITTGLIAQGKFDTIHYIAAVLILAVVAIMLFCNYEKDARFAKGKTAQAEPGGSDGPGGKPEDGTPKNERAEVEKPEIRGIAAYFEKSALPCSIIQLFIAIAHGANLTFLMAYAFFIEVPNPVLYYTLSAVFMVAFRLFTGRLADRTKPVFLIVIGLSFNAVAYTLLLLSHQHTELFYVAGVAAGIASGITGPVMQATVVRMSPEARRGAAMATYTFPMDLGFAIGSFIWGVVLDYSGYPAMYMGCVGCVFIAIALTIALLRKVAPARQIVSSSLRK